MYAVVDIEGEVIAVVVEFAVGRVFTWRGVSVTCRDREGDFVEEGVDVGDFLAGEGGEIAIAVGIVEAVVGFVA